MQLINIQYTSLRGFIIFDENYTYIDLILNNNFNGYLKFQCCDKLSLDN